MSGFGDEKAEGTERQALSNLEAAVGRLLDEMEKLRVRAQRADARVADLESMLRRFTMGEEDPVRLQASLAELDEENRALKSRVREGREGVERLLARIRFLEEAQ